MKATILKSNRKVAAFLLAAIIIMASSCHRNDPGNNNNAASCPGTVTASWKADGKSYQSSAYVYNNPGSLWGLTLAACVSGENDRTLTFNLLPAPVAVGTYPLKFRILHALPPNGYGGADYLIVNGENYFTDTAGVASNGSLTITSVNAADSTFSGTFFFNATNDAGDKTISITDGVLTHIQYQ